MFGIGMPELMIIFVIALLVFGPKELPKIGRTIGKAMADLRRASDDLRDGVQREIDLLDREESEEPAASGETVPSMSPADLDSPAREEGPAPITRTSAAPVPEDASASAEAEGPPEDRLAPDPPAGEASAETPEKALDAAAPSAGTAPDPSSPPDETRHV